MITFLSDTWQDIRALPASVAKDRDAIMVMILTLAPWCILVVRKPDLNDLQPLAGLFGFVTLYWLVCRRQPLKPIMLKKPRLEIAVALGLVAVWILYRVGEYWRWFATPTFWINACTGNGDIVVLKMAEMVIIPFFFLLALKYTLPDLGFSWSRTAWLIGLVPVSALIAFGVTHHPLEQFAASSACYFFDAGLPEEFLFRVFLQTRLEALIHRPAWALWIASFIFGLAHVPIDLHGSFARWPEALLTAFTFQMSAGIALGYAYRWTRNLLPLSIVHMFIDSAF